MPPLGERPHILIVRTSALGDIIHALPVLTALRRRYPEARIGWAVEKTFAPVLADHPWIDELFEVRLRPWRKRPWAVRHEIRNAIQRLRTFRADLAIDLMGNHKGALLARASGARYILGPSRAFRREGSSALWIHRGVDTPGRHAVDRYLDVLAPLGLPPAEVDFAAQHILTQPPDDIRHFLGARERPFVLIQAGAGWANKTWPAPWWGQVARALRDDPGVDVFVPLAPGEESLAQTLVDTSDGAARTVDTRPFAALAAVLRRGRLVLGGDTGPLHMAHAFGTPVLCLVGPTDPERNGPYRSPEQWLWHELPCSNCYKRFDEPKACLLALHPDRVIERARELLATT